EAQRDEHEEPLVEAPVRALHLSPSTRRRNVSPRASKLSNWSKLAQAGERSTVSPGDAAAAASPSADARSPLSANGTWTPARAFAICGAASPIRYARSPALNAAASGSYGSAFPRPP